MTQEDIKKIRLLSAKQRCAKHKLCVFSDQEKEELDRYKKVFGTMKECIGKRVMFYRDFLGIDLETISIIFNYTYRTVVSSYCSASSDFKLIC